MSPERRYFADTGFWIALYRRRDQHHVRGLAWSQHVADAGAQIVTTEAVLWEWMNALAASPVRKRVGEGYRLVHSDHSVKVVDCQIFTSAAVAMYESREDKGWSVTDCHSFVVMSHLKIAAALTTDLDFRQAGFEPLLLREPPARS